MILTILVLSIGIACMQDVLENDVGHKIFMTTSFSIALQQYVVNILHANYMDLVCYSLRPGNETSPFIASGMRMKPVCYFLVSFPDPNNPSEDRLQYLAGKEGLVI